MAKNPRSFRFSDALVDDLQWLSERLRTTHTATIERAVRELRENIERRSRFEGGPMRKARKKSEEIPD